MRVPAVNGLLNYHIKGDEALLYLGRDRYERAEMGAEIHPASPEHLRSILKFTPAGVRSTVHLPYAVTLDYDTIALIRDFVVAGGEKISGYVLHDTLFYATDLAAGLDIIRRLNMALTGWSGAVVHIEYAVGLPFAVFRELAEGISELDNIGICVDIGHIGINATAAAYAELNPGVDVKRLKPGADVTSAVYADIALAVQNGRKFAFDYIESLVNIGVKMHFHLHDGHPLSTFSPYGVCDHLPFFWEIPTLLPDIGSVGGIYGVSGLKRVLEIVLVANNQSQMSYTIEIHPQPGQKELEPGQRGYFSGWTDLTNARAMNFWMDIVIQNAVIFQDLCREILI